MEKLNLHMLLHAGEAKMMCATFNHMDFRDISVFQTNGTGLSFIGESFGDLRIHGISC
jgi:hypothetical protein